LSEKVVIHNKDLLGGNSISDIRRFFEEGAEPFKEREFIIFWQSLSAEDKDEFHKADLS
jgi:hypothetical protein